MSLTPGKEDNINLIKNLTPVRFSDNTRGKSCMQDPNVQTCRDRLDDIISQQKSNFSKWQLAQKRGFAICTSIESIKTRALESRESSRNLKENEETLYPRDLKQHIEKLNIILTIFEDITKHAEELLRQLIKLSKLVGNTDKVFYQSWALSQYINFFDQIYSSYNKENQIKQRVASY
ncbi:uncharacterized protein LOC126753416 isoform X3 [Bactrocera neohumeralis]|uniref:uncharacterized protein LOC126753416 isoform X3 n=1 Tax=Bactrocera neohumeralis TaxID=98809 RepID=UPI0021652DF7|nr:uncharacterized protein LOC126753416 isoform X3 [Bactrocera neohumeralis]